LCVFASHPEACQDPTPGRPDKQDHHAHTASGACTRKPTIRIIPPPQPTRAFGICRRFFAALLTLPPEMQDTEYVLRLKLLTFGQLGLKEEHTAVLDKLRQIEAR
jgi:hypothetical protein